MEFVKKLIAVHGVTKWSNEGASPDCTKELVGNNVMGISYFSGVASILSMHNTYFTAIILKYACFVAVDPAHVHVYRYVKPIMNWES